MKSCMGRLTCSYGMVIQVRRGKAAYVGVGHGLTKRDSIGIVEIGKISRSCRNINGLKP